MWIDVNKGDEGAPGYRSRLVAKEIRRKHEDSIFAATPPLEAKKLPFSLATTSLARSPSRISKPQKLLFIGVKTAYVYAHAIRPVYVELPPEDYQKGYCGRLTKSMYGTTDAAVTGKTIQ